MNECVWSWAHALVYVAKLKELEEKREKLVSGTFNVTRQRSVCDCCFLVNLQELLLVKSKVRVQSTIGEFFVSCWLVVVLCVVSVSGHTESATDEGKTGVFWNRACGNVTADVDSAIRIMYSGDKTQPLLQPAEVLKQLLQGTQAVALSQYVRADCRALLVRRDLSAVPQRTGLGRKEQAVPLRCRWYRISAVQYVLHPVCRSTNRVGVHR